MSRMNKILLLLLSHGGIGFIGFSLGIYLLPVITAPAAPSSSMMASALSQSEYQGQFVKTLADSDFLHWGEGKLLVGPQQIALEGKLAPGPDYKLYLSPTFIETEAEFLASKARMVQVGDIKTFDGFVISVPQTVDVTQYTTVIIWCETFSQFITAASYR